MIRFCSRISNHVGHRYRYWQGAKRMDDFKGRNLRERLDLCSLCGLRTAHDRCASVVRTPAVAISAIGANSSVWVPEIQMCGPIVFRLPVDLCHYMCRSALEPLIDE